MDKKYKKMKIEMTQKYENDKVEKKNDKIQMKKGCNVRCGSCPNNFLLGLCFFPFPCNT